MSGRRRLLGVVAAGLAVLGAACSNVTPQPSPAPPANGGAPISNPTSPPTTAPPAGRVAGEPQVGVEVHAVWNSYSDSDRRTIFAKLAAAGVTWVRIDVGWAGFEPNASGQIEPGYTQAADTSVDEARAAGLHVLMMLWWTPAWANGGGGRTVPPTDPNTFGHFAGWAAQHFQGRVDAFEIWNEPNLSDFFSGTAAQYAALLRAAYAPIKAAAPQIAVVFGAPVYNDTGWLAACYQAGIQGAFDVMATHPYPIGADTPPEAPDDGSIYTIAHVGAVHALMTANGDGGKPIWFTEFGWSSHANAPNTPGWELGVTPAQQADYLVRTLRWVATNAPYVTHVFWYEEKDQSSGEIQGNNMGLLTTALTPKPAYTSLSAHLQS